MTIQAAGGCGVPAEIRTDVNPLGSIPSLRFIELQVRVLRGCVLQCQPSSLTAEDVTMCRLATERP